MTVTVDINKLRELLSKATPGPWHCRGIEHYGTTIVTEDRYPVLRTPNPHRLSDAALVAAAINALPELLDELERTKRALEDLVHARKVKERDGKTLEYEHLRAEAWSQADRILKGGDE